uniref:Uncharacterized protein n=1 Tax=Kalanchoe fedtschenkoi TaxID=63787 RepID=A0A7N0UZN3_KALFE
MPCTNATQPESAIIAPKRARSGTNHAEEADSWIPDSSSSRCFSPRSVVAPVPVRRPSAVDIHLQIQPQTQGLAMVALVLI